MRKIIVFNLISLDGYYAGVNGDISWHKVDDEFNKFAIQQTSEFGTLLFGRTTYKLFEDFWPKALKNPNTSDDDRLVAKNIQEVEKIVFSTTLKKVNWNNSRLVDEINPEEILELKKISGKDIVILGSGTIAQQLTNLDLVDEYRLLVNPILLSKGKLMFNGVKNLELELLSTRKFKNGNILLSYKLKTKY